MKDVWFRHGSADRPLLDVEAHPPGDGIPFHAWGTCPSCGLRAQMDGDQYRGEVSVDCPECAYHETYDYRYEDDAWW